jgi:putative addiction module component (TIGR02574 family)
VNGCARIVRRGTPALNAEIALHDFPRSALRLPRLNWSPVQESHLPLRFCKPPAARMVSADLAKVAFELPPEERLELARRLVESVVAPEPLTEAMAEGIRRIEDVAAGRVAGLTEEQYRAALA